MSIVDAGASGGGEANRWRFLGKRLKLFGFEADDAECAVLQKHAAAIGIEARYFNTFLGRSQPSRPFLIARRFNNSFYETDLSWFQRKRTYLDGRPIRTSEDYVTERTITVESVSLDDWATRYGVPSIDYLKVDIEGAELELLESSPKTLAGLLGLSVDVIFHPTWKQSPVFSDIDVFVRRHGFELFDLQGIKRGSQFDSPFVVPASHRTMVGQIACANAIYLRDPLVAGAAPMNLEGRMKLAGIAEVHGQVEFAFELLVAAAREPANQAEAPELSRIVSEASAQYESWLKGNRLAGFRNRLAPLLRRMVPSRFHEAARMTARTLGLGGNPVYPEK